MCIRVDLQAQFEQQFFLTNVPFTRQSMNCLSPIELIAYVYVYRFVGLLRIPVNKYVSLYRCLPVEIDVNGFISRL